MTARALEASGITTVIIGSALDIVSHCGVPRYLHQDIPLGNPLGHPYAQQEQLETVKRALQMTQTATQAIIEISSLQWHQGEVWRDNYMRIDASNRAALKAAGDENRRQRKLKIAKGEKR